MPIFKEQRLSVRNKIMEISVELFREKGYGNVSIEEITKTVGIAKGTFYNFFPSKKEVLMEWAASVFGSLQFQDAFNPGLGMKDNLFRLIDILTDAMVENGNMFVSFLEELLHSSGGIVQNDQFNIPKIFYGVMRASADYDPDWKDFEERVSVLNSAVFLAVVDWFRLGKPVGDIKQHLKSIVAICLFGILPRV